MKAVLPARISRRGFLKNSITGAAVFGVAPYLFLPKSAAGVREGSCHHPNIDGLRVVGVHDPGMTSEIVPVCPWTHQEGLVVARAVEENMNRMVLSPMAFQIHSFLKKGPKQDGRFVKIRRTLVLPGMAQEKSKRLFPRALKCWTLS